MMTPQRKRLSAQFLFEQALQTFMRFPFSILSAVLAAATVIYMIETKLHPDDYHLVCALGLGIPLFLATTLFRESRGFTSAQARVVELVFGGVLLALYQWLTESDFTQNYPLRYLQISLVLHLCVAFAAFGKASQSGKFWQFNRAIFLRILLSALYSSVFYIGLLIAILTTEKLFEFTIHQELYIELWIIAAFVLQTWHFLAGVPKLEELKDETPFPQGLRIFVQYLLIPLVSLYIVILYAYMAKILIQHEWPKGYLGWLVSIMAVLGVFNLLLIDPERKRSDSGWIAVYAKSFYVLIIPLLLMLYTAVFTRVNAYGITEPRYFLVLLPSLLLIWALYFIFSKGKRIEIIPVSLCIVCLVSLAGPWSAYSVSFRSQKARAEVVLQRNALLQDGRLTKSVRKVSNDDQIELNSIFSYLLSSHGIDKLSNWLTPSQLQEIKSQHPNPTAVYDLVRSDDLLKIIGVDSRNSYDFQKEKSANFSFDVDLYRDALDLSGFQQLVQISFAACKPTCETSIYVNGREFKILQTEGPARLEVRDPKNLVAAFDLRASVAQFRVAAEGAKSKTLHVDQLSAKTLNGSKAAKFFIDRISGKYRGEEPSVEALSGRLLLNLQN